MKNEGENELVDENKLLKEQLENKQKHIVLLEGKIHRMRDNIKRLEGLYHYAGWEGAGDVKKECYQFKKKYTQLEKENEQLKKEIKRLKYHLNETEKELQEYKDFMSLG